MFAPWWEFSTDAVMLAVEAQSVIAMRLTSIALGAARTPRTQGW
jgi:hypothetical protein